MAKRTLSKRTPATEEKPHLFFLRIPTDHPDMSPNAKLHLGLAAAHLEDQIGHLETVEQLAGIDEESDVIHAMSYSLTAVLKKLKDVHQHFTETIELIESVAAGKGGEA